MPRMSLGDQEPDSLSFIQALLTSSYSWNSGAAYFSLCLSVLICTVG